MRRAALAVTWSVAALALGGSSCREELGQPDYSSHVGLRPDGGVPPEFLSGTDPYIPGMERLAIGLFYEGGVSARVPLGPGRDYFIFQGYDQDTVEDRVEGILSDRFTLTGEAFWGGGVIWEEPTDLSRWSTLAVALKSEDPSFAVVTVTMQSGEGGVVAHTVDAAAYGYAPDGQWHALRIPLADFAGLDRRHVRSPFILGGTGSGLGDRLLVDEVYLTRD